MRLYIGILNITYIMGASRYKIMQRMDNVSAFNMNSRSLLLSFRMAETNGHIISHD